MTTFEIGLINAKCNLNKKERLLVKKNPHSCSLFCTIDNIINCDQDNCHKKKGFKYSKWCVGKKSRSTTQLKNYNWEKIYKQPKLYKTIESIPDYGFTYESVCPSFRSNLHWGQLKLFLTLLQFLNLYSPKNKEFSVVYAGAAPGYNITGISKLFPKSEWYLIDPNPFDDRLYNNPQIKEVKNELFLDNTAKYYNKLLKGRNVLFISDIRTTTEEASIHINDVFENQEWQLSWHKILKPKY